MRLHCRNTFHRGREAVRNEITKEKLVSALRAVIGDVEELLKTTASQTGEGVADLRGRLEKVQQTYMRHQQDLQGKEQKETAKIFERMTKIISEIAAGENFTMIVDKSALVFAKPHLDLTNELIRRYNKTAAPAGPAAKAPPAKK